MNIKDANCPFCGRQDFFPALKLDTEHFNLFEGKLPNINLNDNLNNASSIYYNPKYQYNPSEKNNINNNSICCTNNSQFSIINNKNKANNNKNIKEGINNYYNKVKVKKKLGRKTKRSTESNIGNDNSNNCNSNKKVHDRNSDDNMRKKCKNLILKFLLEFINSKIKDKYNNNLGHGNSEKVLKVLNQKYKKATVSSDSKFMDKTLKDIFSLNISDKFCNYSLDHNKLVIKSLINEEDETKRNYFDKLFNLKFRDCLMSLKGEKYYEELEGFQNLTDIKNYLLKKEEEGYADYFVSYLKNFEERLNKREKASKKIKKKSEIFKV